VGNSRRLSATRKQIAAPRRKITNQMEALYRFGYLLSVSVISLITAYLQLSETTLTLAIEVLKNV